MDNSGKEKEAMALIAEAEKKMKSSQSFLGGLFGGSSKMEEACEMYVRAANMYKMAKKLVCCRKCILPGCSPSPSDAEQTRCGD